ncbi:MAG: CoB--CoM heterodisulfide reductase iron-sulfur subunit A family protein [Nitrospiraceae bacterium]|nr:MAG: CoB--CoM heterodisulfide reductase iron-sulfur subunit A family protein [Nitrospiraceae bacterium]
MAENKKILIIGGGMSGLTAAVETAEAGNDAVIVEKTPFLGGRVAQLNKYFPKLCPPNCGLEINFKRIKNNADVTFYTLAEVEKISGEEGNYNVAVKLQPRFINDNCTGCNACAEACPVEMPNEFNFGLDKTKTAYIAHNQAFPFKYAIDARYCKGKACAKCVDACKYNAIDLDMKAETVNLNVASVVIATGWDPYDAGNLDILGGGKIKNVITNMQMERLASPNGPTSGKILRPSDNKEVKNIAFVQCAGSRDENHLPYCSYICCMASLKQATYLREQYPDSKVRIFYIDIRTPGRYEQFYWKVKEDPNVTLTKGKVAKVAEDTATGDVELVVEDVLAGKKITEKYEMVVLATGMVPSTKNFKIPGDISYTNDGFVAMSSLKKGIYAVGTAKNPVDVAKSVQEATGVAIKSIQSARRSK